MFFRVLLVGFSLFRPGVVITALMCVTWIGPSQGVRLRLGALYIDVSFPRPSSAPHLDIRVHRHSNRTGLRSLYYSARVLID